MRKVNVKRHIRKKGKKVIPVRSHKRNISVPPAWTNVSFPKNEPYIAKGQDSKGRWQYIYPKSHSQSKETQKFKRVNRLKKKIPQLLPELNKDIKEGRQEAEVIYTMYKTGFRPGTDKDTKAEEEAFGTLTLLKDHVKVKPDNKVEFSFIGKKGIEIEKEIKDKKLADIIKERKTDKKLFQTTEKEVREYLRKKLRGDFQLKDFRTLKAVDVAEKVVKQVDTKKELGEQVAKELGNTPTIALNSYIPPEIKEKVTS